MDEVTSRELRSHSGDVLHRAEQGDPAVSTRAGGELQPVPRPPLSATPLLARWRTVPVVDAGAFRTDVDAVLDPAL